MPIQGMSLDMRHIKLLFSLIFTTEVHIQQNGQKHLVVIIIPINTFVNPQKCHDYCLSLCLNFSLKCFFLHHLMCLTYPVLHTYNYRSKTHLIGYKKNHQVFACVTYLHLQHSRIIHSLIKFTVLLITESSMETFGMYLIRTDMM